MVGTSPELIGYLLYCTVYSRGFWYMPLFILYQLDLNMHAVVRYVGLLLRTSSLSEGKAVTVTKKKAKRMKTLMVKRCMMRT